MKLNHSIVWVWVVLILSVSVAQAGPADQWRDRRGDFRAVLVEQGHDRWCDWARLSVYIMMSYTAAKNEGARREWSAGQINALRHALWQYQLSHAFGVQTAQALGDQQERYSTDLKDSAIDQHNNQAARALYITNKQAQIPLDQAIRAIVHSINTQDAQFITNPNP